VTAGAASSPAGAADGSAAVAGRVSVVHEHPEIRHRVALVMQDHGMSVTCVSPGALVRPGYRAPQAQVVLLGDRALLARARQAWPQAGVLLFGTATSLVSRAGAVAAGAHGYLSSEAHHYQSLWRPRRHQHVPGSGGITEIQLRILELMARGFSNAAIAMELDLATDTVKTHALRLFRRLGVKDRAGAVGVGFRLGLLS